MKRVIIIFFLLFPFLGKASVDDAQRVYDQLNRSFGTTDLPKPKLIILNNETLIAQKYMGEIYVGNRFLQLCSRFGKDSLNAMAYILSHELVHYYMRHNWASEFGFSNKDTQWGKKMARDDDSASKYVELYETQAEELGFFHALSSGYNTAPIAPAMLDSLYKWFGLEPIQKGYPPLDQRKLIARNGGRKAAKLISVFEMSNHLKALSGLPMFSGNIQADMLDFSGYCLSYIMSENVKSVEIYNNIAVAKIMKAQKYANSIYGSLELPLILDQNSILYQASSTKGGNDLQIFKELMKSASLYLEKALEMDETYWPAIINKAILNIGLGNLGSAEDQFNNQDLKNQVKTNNQIKILQSELKGLIAYFREDSAKGKTLLAEAKKLGSQTAVHNQNLLNHLNIAIPENSQSFEIDTSEKWNGKIAALALIDLKLKTEPENVLSFSNNEGGTLDIVCDTVAGYKVIELIQRVGRTCAFDRIKTAEPIDSRLKTSRGIGKNDSMEAMMKKYGTRPSISYGTKNNYYYYPQNNIVFLCNPTSQKVESWFYYVVK